MKKLWKLFPALILIAGLLMMGCPGPDNDDDDDGDDPTPPTGDITWTLSQDGEEDADGVGTKTTTKITITLSAPADLNGNSTVVLSTGNVTRGVISGGTGAGIVWEIPVTVTNPGNVSVTINRTGVEAGPKNITVFKEGVATPIIYTAAADGSAGTVTSTKITFTFEKAVTGLEASHIAITDGTGAATKGALTAVSTTVYDLAISGVSEGTVTVKITKDGIDAGNQPVTVYKGAVTSDYDITELTYDTETAEEAGFEGGIIWNDDFDAVMAAKYGSFLRITIDTSGNTKPGAEPGWGVGAIGNFMDDAGEEFEGARNYSIVWPASGDTVDIPIYEIKRYINENDEFIYLACWDGVVITKIELYAKKVADTPPVLDDGVIAILGLPNGGKLGYADYMLIMSSPDNYFLRLYSNASLGGSIGSSWANGAGQTETVALSGTIFNITVEKLKELGIGDSKEIVINVWNGAITKIELREPSQVTPIDVLKDGTLIANATVEEGTFASGEITIEHSGSDYTLLITFDTPVDITGLEELEFEWSGIYSGNGTFTLNNWGAQTKILFGSDGVSHDTVIESSPGVVNFAGDEVNWNDAWDEVDKTQCVGIQIFSNWAGKTDGSAYPNLDAADYEDLIITRITFK